MRCAIPGGRSPKSGGNDGGDGEEVVGAGAGDEAKREANGFAAGAGAAADEGGGCGATGGASGGAAAEKGFVSGSSSSYMDESALRPPGIDSMLRSI